ncbi:MAG: ATP-dependent helicase HrpB, partial [Acidimicrobiales bacterium]
MSAVLQAPPGAGKTTRVPLLLREASWLGDQRVVMLEPRRVAARSAATRLAELLGTHVGGVVGYRMRDDTKVGPQTRIEVVTEGVLTNMLQTDPSLSDVGVVIFDEFHERSIHADLGLALCIEVQSALRPELRILVMSATLEGSRLAQLLDQAPVVQSEGFSHVVTTEYRPRVSDMALETHLATVVSEIWSDHDTDVLAFLPGARWIERAGQQLRTQLGHEALITPLFSALPAADQEVALRPDPRGQRKVILATDIAETSLTIEGVGVVVDSGRRRAPRLDSRTGLTRLETVRVSRASADQRRGRAGRLGPGACYRLWDESENRHLEAFEKPEILSVDLSALQLQLACWGASATELRWLDSPPAHLLNESAKLLRSLGAMDDDDRPTPHGQAMRNLGVEPRLAHMLLRAAETGRGALGCELAALLTSRVTSNPDSADITDRVRAMRNDTRHSGSAQGRARAEARRLASRLGVEWKQHQVEAAGPLLAMAYPDRIGLKRNDSDAYLLSSGRGAALRPSESLVGSELLVVPDVDGDPARSVIRLAAALDRFQLEEALGSLFERTRVIEWDPSTKSIAAELRTTLGAVVLKREPID